MLFESRKILIGFRIKLNFDASLEKENSYVFVNLSETPTIQDLLNVIKRRFEISKDIYIVLNDCRLLNSEDNSVLIDVHEIKIVPCKLETSVVPSETSFHRVPPRDSSFGCNNITQIVENNTVSNNDEVIPTLVEELSSDKKRDDNVLCKKEISNRKSKRFYTSIAETIKYLNQNYKPELENENLSVLPINEAPFEVEDHRKGSIKNAKELIYFDDDNFEKTSEECAEKRKRKRKRKNSKKMKPECDRSDVIRNICDQYPASSTETNIDNISTKATRQHIFFNVENDDSVQDDQHDSSFPVRLCNKESRKFENSVENVVNNAGNTNGIADTTNSGCCRLTNNENFMKKSVIHDSVTESSAVPCNLFFESEAKSADVGENSCLKYVESEDSDSLLTLNGKYQTMFEKSTNSHSKLSSNNGFFSTFDVKSNNRYNFQEKKFPTENAHPLSTLLMCKQLQAPVEYNVQFVTSRSRSNSCISVASKKSAHDGSIGNLNSTILMDSNDDDECEVLCQYKIAHDKVLLRDSNGMWNILSEKEASLKLQPVEEPLVNQSITFQLLYLGPDMCPSMSDLICGKVISVQKSTGKLVVNILPAFIDTLLKNFREDECLPDELVHISENAYEIPWIAMKNPRLLM